MNRLLFFSDRDHLAFLWRFLYPSDCPAWQLVVVFLCFYGTICCCCGLWSVIGCGCGRVRLSGAHGLFCGVLSAKMVLCSLVCIVYVSVREF